MCQVDNPPRFIGNGLWMTVHNTGGAVGKFAFMVEVIRADDAVIVRPFQCTYRWGYPLKESIDIMPSFSRDALLASLDEDTGLRSLSWGLHRTAMERLPIKATIFYAEAEPPIPMPVIVR